MSSMNPVIDITLIVIIVLAIFTIITPRVRKSIILSGIMSVTASFAYVLLAAPDIALTEAVVGTTITTVLLLVAIKKSKIFIVYYIKRDEVIREDIMKSIEQILKESEYELQFVCTTETVNFLKNNYSFELLIEEKEDIIHLYGEYANLTFVDIVKKLKSEFGEDLISSKNIHDIGGDI